MSRRTAITFMLSLAAAFSSVGCLSRGAADWDVDIRRVPESAPAPAPPYPAHYKEQSMSRMPAGPNTLAVSNAASGTRHLYWMPPIQADDPDVASRERARAEFVADRERHAQRQAERADLARR